MFQSWKVDDVLLQDNLGDHPDVRFAVDYSSTNVQKESDWIWEEIFILMGWELIYDKMQKKMTVLFEFNLLLARRIL